MNHNDIIVLTYCLKTDEYNKTFHFHFLNQTWELIIQYIFYVIFFVIPKVESTLFLHFHFLINFISLYQIYPNCFYFLSESEDSPRLKAKFALRNWNWDAAIDVDEDDGLDDDLIDTEASLTPPREILRVTLHKRHQLTPFRDELHEVDTHFYL